MDARGRSRDVSPIALARRKLIDSHPHIYYPQPPILLNPSNLPLPSPPHDHRNHPPTKSRSTTPTPTIPSPPPFHLFSPSASPPGPSFMRTLSSSTLSVSPDPSASGPLTPPEYAYSPIDHRSLDYYDSPPSPPRTLQDQIHVAYALDNIHLAKVLLLKLQGIEVTDDDDPRIAQVKDADFDDAFVPPGALMLDEELETRCREAERHEHERRRRRAREERLKACERIWESSVESVREEKDRVARRRDDRLRARRRSQMEAREREREAKERQAERVHDAFARHTRTTRVPAQRAVLSYGSLPACSNRMASSDPPRTPRQLSFQYPVMQPLASPPSSTRHLSSSPKSPLRAYNEFAVQSRHVSFPDVIAAMHGPLFPVGMEEEERCTLRRNAAQVKLFDELLRPGRWDGDESRSPVRAKDRMPQRRTVEDCVACSLVSASSSSRTAVSESASTETTVRSPASHSWFAFSVRSSISTLLTTPSRSPLLLAKDVDGHVPVEAELEPVVVLRHSCPHSARVLVDEHPLTSAPREHVKPSFVAPSPLSPVGRASCSSSPLTPSCPSSSHPSKPNNARRLMKHVTRSVTTFLDMATTFQRAYVSATMSNTGVDGYAYDWDSESRSRSRSGSRSRSVSIDGRRKWRVRQEGYRACVADVAVFVALPPPPLLASASSGMEDDDEAETTRPLIALHPLFPLSSTSSSSNSASGSSSAASHHRKLPPPAQPPRSPFRLPYPPPTLTSRLRPIANPLLLRMKALQNTCGVGVSGDGGMGSEVKEVREKMVGVAWEGIGRSGLGWEVQVSVC